MAYINVYNISSSVIANARVSYGHLYIFTIKADFMIDGLCLGVGSIVLLFISSSLAQRSAVNYCNCFWIHI